MLLFLTNEEIDSLFSESFSSAKYSTNLNLRVKSWTSFSNSKTFLLGVGVNLRPLLNTFIWVLDKHILEIFITLG